MPQLPQLIRALVLTALAFFIAVTAGSMLGIISLLLSDPHNIRDYGQRNVLASNLRQIGQAALIYASDHGGNLPEAENIADYARALALDGELNDASLWVAFTHQIDENHGTVLIKSEDDTRTLDPHFATLPHLYRVVLGGVKVTDAPTTPIAWTRGLNLETGEWSRDSLFSWHGGHVLFLNGDVRFYETLQNAAGGELRDRAGLPTHQIVKTLPASARIAEDPPSHRRDRMLPVNTAYHLRENVIPIALLLWMLALWLVMARAFIVTASPKPPQEKRGPKPVTLCLLSLPAILMTLSWLARV